jgi:cell fate regulator YaaT (PSP1 superfamily)
MVRKKECNFVYLFFANFILYFRDRRKLTFYFNAEKRIDFRELVRELFKIYKTRIWM